MILTGKRRNRNLLIGCVVLIIVACLAIGALAAVTGGAIGTVFNQFAEGPYKIARRSTPSGVVVDTLLPLTVGNFTRSDSAEWADGEALTTYADGRVQINARMIAFNTPADAQAQVLRVKRETDGLSGNRTSVTGFDPSYVRLISGGVVRMAWSRGAYFYDVQASTEHDLDRFMADFPY